MIFESGAWKDDLLKTAQSLSNRLYQKRWTERSFVLLEKEIFISFYAIRKLIEAQKVSYRFTQEKINVKSFRSVGKEVHRFNRDNIYDLYDLKHPSIQSMQLKQLCNQFIHSYIFIPSFGKSNDLEGIFFCSDFARKKSLFKLKIVNVIRVFEKIGSDYPSQSHRFYNEKNGDYVVYNFTDDDL